MILKTVAAAIFLSQLATTATACIDQYNEGKSYLNQGVGANNQAAELYQWVMDNDSSLDTAEYCGHVTEVKRLYSESTYNFRRASDALQVALSKCDGDNKNTVRDVLSKANENLQYTVQDGEVMQNLLYQYCN